MTPLLICSAYSYIAAYVLGRTITDNDKWVDIAMGAVVTLFWLPLFLILCAIAFIDYLQPKKHLSDDNKHKLQDEGNIL